MQKLSALNSHPSSCDDCSNTVAYGAHLQTPWGCVRAEWDPQGALVSLSFPTNTPHATPHPIDHEGLVGLGAEGSQWAALLQTQLAEYSQGLRTQFDVPLNPKGTEFQKKVWSELVNIPCGTTLSYSALALKLGLPKAARAVGRANGANPIALLIPCHRVVGARGDLTGYAGGLTLKAQLLDHEKAWHPSRSSALLH